MQSEPALTGGEGGQARGLRRVQWGRVWEPWDPQPVGMSASPLLNQKVLEEFREAHGEGWETGTGLCIEVFVVNALLLGETRAEVWGWRW